jgi:hypothetical protein
MARICDLVDEVVGQVETVTFHLQRGGRAVGGDDPSHPDFHCDAKMVYPWVDGWDSKNVVGQIG